VVAVLSGFLRTLSGAGYLGRSDLPIQGETAGEASDGSAAKAGHPCSI